MSREETYITNDLADLCTELDIKCVVQVGAEDGYEAHRMKYLTYCNAVAIEGNPACTSMYPDIDFHTAIIGATNEFVHYYIHEDGGLSGRLPRNDYREKQIRARQYRLDTFCDYHGIKPDALIIDTEGTTLDVLNGCDTLMANIKLIYAECQKTVFRPGVSLVQDVDVFLKECGMKMRKGSPSYEVEVQGNYTWVRE